MAAFTILALLVALALLTVGLRGRRADDHPLCRRCGYDLTGRNEMTTRCPECGISLTRHRAIRTGHRTRRRAPLAAGIALLAVGLGLGLSALVPRLLAAKWIRYEPIIWLFHDIDRRGVRETAAFDELSRRISAGQMSPRQIKAVVDRALNAQADRSKLWQRGWADVLASAASTGQMSPADGERMVAQAVSVSLNAPPSLHRGRDATVRLRVNWDRLPGGIDVTDGRFEATALRLDRVGRPFHPIGPGVSGDQYVDGGGFWMRLYVGGMETTFPPEPEPDMDDGGGRLHQLFTDVNIEVDRVTTGNDSIARIPPNPWNFTPVPMTGRPVKIALRASTTITFENHSASAAKAFVVDPTRRGAEQAAVAQAWVSVSPKEWKQWYPGCTTVQLHVDRPPMAVAADVILRQGGHEQRVGSCLIKVGERSDGHFISSSGEAAFREGRVDVILRPAPAVADERVPGPYWGEEIVIPGVQVFGPP